MCHYEPDPADICPCCRGEWKEECEQVRKDLQLYKETIAHIKTTVADYKSQPALGLEVVLTLAKGVK